MESKQRLRVRMPARVIASVVSMLCILGWSAGVADGSVFRRLAGGVASFASDGQRFVAWQHAAGGPIEVFDTRRGSVSSFAIPAGCMLANEAERVYGRVAGGGRFLLDCAPPHTEAQLLLDARSGALIELPPLGYGDHWVAVGTDYALGLSYPTDEGKPEPSFCPQSRFELDQRIPCLAIMGLSQKMVTYRPESLWPDLNVSGAPEICPTLRSKLITETRESIPRFLDYSEGYYAQPTQNDKSVELDRCSGSRILLRPGGTAGEPENFDVRGGLLSWDTGEPSGVDVERGSPRRFLSIYQYRARRVQRWKLPIERIREKGNGVSLSKYPLGYSTHTANAVFWIATESCEPTNVGCVARSSVVFEARMQ
jgi:hypothetical protein